MGVRGESMNPMTFGNMTHPNNFHWGSHWGRVRISVCTLLVPCRQE